MMNTMNSALSGAYPMASNLGGNQTRPICHPPVRMNSNGQNDSFIGRAIREGILDSSENYETTESGILLSTTKADSFIIRPKFEIFMPECNSGILLV